MENALMIPWGWVSTGIAIAVFGMVVWLITREPKETLDKKTVDYVISKLERQWLIERELDK